MIAMCSTAPIPYKMRCHIYLYDTYFKSYDKPPYLKAAILDYPIWPPGGIFSLAVGGFGKALVITITGRNLIKLYKSERSFG